MNVERGDVVMVDWHFSDRTGVKRRPALVVQANVYNQTLEDTILALISSSVRRKVGAATQQTEFILKGAYLGLLVLVAMQAPDWMQAPQVAMFTLGGLVLGLATNRTPPL